MSKSFLYTLRTSAARIRVGIAIFLAISVVATASYLLGLSHGRAMGTIPPIVYSQSPMTTLPALPLGGEVVGHQGKDLYWGPWCKEAWDVAGDKQIWFPSEEYAIQKGYRPAKTCKGLKTSE